TTLFRSRVTTSSPSRCSTVIRCGTVCESSPSGPLTITRPGETDTCTPAGSWMGLFPIRLIRLPYETHDFAADTELLRRATRHEASRRGHDRRPHAPEDTRETVLARV